MKDDLMKRLFPSLPDAATLGDVFTAFPDTVAPLMEFHDRLLRGDSPLSVAERELIAAYVSGLNACTFCHDAHRIHAKAHGIPLDTIDALMADLDSAPVDDRLKPILRYVAKLTQNPSRMTEADAEDVYAAGWNERALFDAVLTCATFNMMNRILEGTGITSYSVAPEDVPEDGLAMRRSATAYSDFGRTLGVMD